MPKFYSRKHHIDNLVDSVFYQNLVILRDCIASAADQYFQNLGAPKVDLYLIAREVSSPIAKGSDSLPLPIHIGKKQTYLVDSAQFGMEPLVQKKFKMVYCYLPSFRGENSDDRHLNQFFHCEAELIGGYIDAMNVAEGLVKYILKNVGRAYQKKDFRFKKHNFKILNTVIKPKYPRISFDQAEALLNSSGFSKLIEKKSFGRVLTGQGEKKLVELLTGNKTPVWLTRFDRDTVPFYQMPDPKNQERTLNADLLFPSVNGGFGGELVGSGQRQKTSRSMLVSMKRQGVKDVDNYGWYLNLRKRSDYKQTAGFGLGIERLIAWMLGLNSIVDACIYPVIKTDFQ